MTKNLSNSNTFFETAKNVLKKLVFLLLMQHAATCYTITVKNYVSHGVV
jgi:hypothetical protein